MNILFYIVIFALISCITITLHTQDDIPYFLFLVGYLSMNTGKSLRLNIFKEIQISAYYPNLIEMGWVIKDNIEWIEDYPLLSNETFMRL